MESDDYVLSLAGAGPRHQWHRSDDTYEGQLPICPWPECPRGYPGKIMLIPKKPVWKKCRGVIELQLSLEMPKGGADKYRRVEWFNPWQNRGVIMWRLV